MKSLLPAILVAVLLAGCATTTQQTVQTPDISIHQAFKVGDIDAVKQHVAAGTDVNEAGPNAGLSPLHRAVYYGHHEIVELLLAKGADVNAKEEVGWTPLHYAAAMNRKGIADLLLVKGADVDAKDIEGKTPTDVGELEKNKEIVAGPDIGGREKILKKTPSNLGYTNVPNWLKFPPADHPDWEFDGDVVGVAVDSKDNVFVSHRGDRAPRLTVWKPDGSLLRIFSGPKTKGRTW